MCTPECLGVPRGVPPGGVLVGVPLAGVPLGVPLDEAVDNFDIKAPPKLEHCGGVKKPAGCPWDDDAWLPTVRL